MALYTSLCFGCSYFHISSAFLPEVFLCSSGANSAVSNSVCLGAWSCAFCTSEDLDVKYFFEPNLVFLKVLCTCWFYCISMYHKFKSKNKCSFHKVIIYLESLISSSVFGFREQWAFTFSSEGLLPCCPFPVENTSWFWTVFCLKLQYTRQNCCTFYWNWKGVICVLKL